MRIQHNSDDNDDNDDDNGDDDDDNNDITSPSSSSMLHVPSACASYVSHNNVRNPRMSLCETGKLSRMELSQIS